MALMLIPMSALPIYSIFAALLLLPLSTTQVAAEDSFWLETAGLPIRAPVNAISVDLCGGIMAGTSRGLVRSTDKGDNWRLDTTIAKSSIWSFYNSGEGFIIAGAREELFRTRDCGEHWDHYPVGSIARIDYWRIVEGKAGVLYAVTGKLGGWPGFPLEPYFSNDSGKTWELYCNPWGGGIPLAITVANNGEIFTGHEIGLHSIYRSTPGSDTCLPVLEHNRSDDIRALAVNSQGHILAGGIGREKFLISEDNGNTWWGNEGTNGYPRFAGLWTLYVDKHDRIYAGTGGYGIVRSSDKGRNWEELAGVDFQGTTINAFAEDSSGYLYAGTGDGRVFRSRNPIYTVDNVNTGIEQTTNFHIQPNPINKSGTAHFTLSANTRVSLSVHDLFGNTVAQPLNNVLLEPGSHGSCLNTGTLAPGVYYAHLRSGNIVRTARVVVIH